MYKNTSPLSPNDEAVIRARYRALVARGLISDPAVRPQFAALRTRDASEAAIGAAKVVLL